MNAFVVAAKKAALTAGYGHVQLFEFEEEALRDFQQNDDHELQAPGVWGLTDPASKEVHELVSMMPEDFSPQAIASTLACAGHGVLLRQGLGARHIHQAASTLRNEFVVLQTFGGLPVDLELIIESRFRARFELTGFGSEAYTTMMSVLPRVFVGTERQLSHLVQYAARVLAYEYKLLQREVPPWRTATALLSLWLPPRMREWSPDMSPPPSPFSVLSPSESTEGSPVGSHEAVLPYHLSPWSEVKAKVQVKTVYGFGAVEQVQGGGVGGKVMVEERKVGVVRVDSLTNGSSLPRVYSVRVHPQWLM